MNIILVPYLKDYKNKQEVINDFLKGKDFLINDFFCPYDNKPCNINDLKKANYKQVKIRYNKLTKFVFINI